MFFYYGLLSLFFLGCGSDKGNNSEDGSIVDQKNGGTNWKKKPTIPKMKRRMTIQTKTKKTMVTVGKILTVHSPCEGSWEDTICLQDNFDLVVSRRGVDERRRK